MTREQILKAMVGMELRFVAEVFQDEEVDILFEEQYGREEDYQIYADRKDSEIYCVEVERLEDGNNKIIKAW